MATRTASHSRARCGQSRRVRAASARRGRPLRPPGRGRASSPRSPVGPCGDYRMLQAMSDRHPRAPYPSHREADVVLRDGSTVHVRPARPGDREAVTAFLQGLSPQSRYFRFFAPVKEVERLASSAVDVDHRTRFSLLATAGPAATVVGHAIYILSGEGRAEVAFAVADHFQGHGLGTILLAHLAEAATENGIRVFEARVLAENHRMIEVFRESGFPVRMRAEPGEIAV